MSNDLIPSGAVPEETTSPDSIYQAYQNYVNGGKSLQDTGYGQSPWQFGDRPDRDPLGVRSTEIAESGSSPLTSNTVTGLTLADGTWRTRDELMATDYGRRLVESEENIRRGMKRGFWDSLKDTTWHDFVPFVGTLASVGGSLRQGKLASDFFRKSLNGEATTDDEAIAASLYQREGELQRNGTWGYTFGSIVRQAPAFCLEFGLLGKAGQMARSAAVKGIVGKSTDEAAVSAARYGVSRAVKTGADETMESAVRAWVASDLKQNAGRTAAQSVRALAGSPELRKSTIDAVAKVTSDLMDGAANAVADVPSWAPGLQAKTSRVLAERAFDSVVRRMSPDLAVQRAWRGTVQSVQKAVAEGFMDLGQWGSEAATTITTGHARAGKAAMDAMTQLTFGALARGSALYLPKEAVTRTVGAAVGGTNRSALDIESAAWQRGDADLMSKADVYGAMLDLLEYVSENTGRGFNSLGRAVGLKVAPGLMRPASKVAGLTHIVGADVKRDASGKAIGVVYNGLLETGTEAQAGGKIRQFLEKAFGSRALRDNVASDQFRAVERSLADRGLREVNDTALRNTIATGTLQAGLSPEVASAIGENVRKFTSDAVKAANRAGLEGMKYRTFMTYWAADFLTRHNIDAIAAGDMFRQMGYDGVVSEMLEERYSDFASELFGLNARTDKGFANNLSRAVKSAFAVDPDTGEWKWDQLTAEAAAFSVPMLARAGTMRAIASLGGPNEFSRFKANAGDFLDATRYGTVFRMREGDYLKSLQEQEARLSAVGAKARERYAGEIAARESERTNGPGSVPRVALDDNVMRDLQDTVKRTETAVSRLRDVKKHFMESVAPGDGYVTVPVISDEDFMAPAETYNLMLKTKESQDHLRQSESAGTRLVDAAPQMFQTMFRMEDRDRVKEDAGWFRKASHWIVEHAVRLSGVAVTGDMSFLSVNPARFAAADLGVPGDIMDMGHRMYGNAFRQNLRAMQEERARDAIDGKETPPPGQADYEACHAKTLADISESAKQLMTTALAAHQTRMFADDELRDVAMHDVAAEDGLYTDAARMVFVSEDGKTEIPFADYLSREGVEDRIESCRRQYAVELFELLASGTGERRMFETNRDETIRAVNDVLTVPKDLPTARQAIAAKLMRLPQFRGNASAGGVYRGTVLAREADGSRTIDDHFNDGMTVRKRWMDAIIPVLLPGGVGSVTADTNLSEVYANIENVHPAILADVARTLNLSDDGSRSGIERRNREIAELAVMQAVASDGNARIFSRASTSEERESRFTSPFGLDAPARNVGGKWTVRITERNAGRTDTVVEAPTLMELTAKLEPYGYVPADQKVVFTSYQVLQSSDPLEMIRVLGLGTEYERRLNALSDEYRDPLLRRTDAGEDEFSDEDSASAQRETERQKAIMFEDRGKSDEPGLYLRSGESMRDPAAAKRARLLAKDCRDCWYRRNGRDGKTGEARGYVSVANDILRENGVTVPHDMTDNRFGLASQGRRQKYAVSIRTIKDRGMSRNVYVPINHTDAQDYQSALLEASLFTEYSRNRMYISDVYRSQVASFMDHVNRVCLDTATSLAAGGNQRVADAVERFRVETVARPDGSYRLPSPSTFAKFVSAFNLFRTEVPGIRRQSVLGSDAEALCAIAADVRKGVPYVGWTSVVDLMLGGSGLEVSALNGEPPKTGLGKYYALWKPAGSPTLDKAVEAAHPGKGTFAEFADSAVRQAQATVQSAVSNMRPGPLSALAVAQQIAIEEELGADRALERIAEATGEVSASSKGGDVREDLPGEEGPASPVEEWSDIDDDDLPSMKYVERFVETSDTSVPPEPSHVNASSLLPSETTSLVRTFANMAAIVNGSTEVNAKMFRDFYRRFVTVPRQADYNEAVRTFNALQRDGKLSIDSSWSLSDIADKDEEGMMPDGGEGNNHRSVEILKSKALNDWLAMFSVVSPQTGRDFQPLIEDFRSLLRAAPNVTERTPDLEEADRFLSWILNPRAEDSVDNAPDRDALWRHRMEWFEERSGHRKDIARYIRAYVGEEGKPPVNARAALFLSYLMSLDDRKAINTRLSLASLAGSCAPAQPVRLSRKGDFGHVLAPRLRKGGENNMDAVVGSFARLYGKSGAEISRIASDLESGFRSELSGASGRSLYGGKARSVFETYARVLAPVFGFDSPIVSVFLSRPMYGQLFRDSMSKTVPSLRKAFATEDGNFGGLPFAAYELVDTLRRLGRIEKPTASDVNEAAVEMFQSGAKSARQLNRAATSLQGRSAWMTLFRAYADARPVSVMTAEVNPERTNQPATSLAITMPGIEPALLEFLDRKDGNGFAAVLRKWFPKRFEGLSDAEARERIADYRQRMIWPNSAADLIVAKSVSKSALASETLDGCESAYNDGNAENMVYVPVFSGDHSSSIILQVPLLKEFREAGLDYDGAASMVSKWIGLDMLGADAKRSFVTCGEAPGTAMRDFRYNPDGSIALDADGKPIRGHAYVSILWNSDPDADNEAMIGTSEVVGYGARRQKEMSKDMGSSTLKIHVAAASQDETYGPVLTLIKSLAVSPGPADARNRGQFLECAPMGFVTDFSNSVIRGEEDISSCVTTDFDSVKLSQANSKTVGVGNGQEFSLMKHVFSRLRSALDAGGIVQEDGSVKEIGSRLSGSELDDLIGDIEWTDLSGGSRKTAVKRLSELLDGVEIREVRRPGKTEDYGGHRMFGLVFRADNQMAFQVANVSHRAVDEFGRTPRNYMTDSLALSRVVEGWNGDTAGGTDVFRGKNRVCEGVKDLVTSWGFTAAAISSQTSSIDNMMADDEEWNAARAKGMSEGSDLASDMRQRKFAAVAKRDNLAIQFDNESAPLVTNAGWIGKDGRAHSHSASRMFNDTIQGARTIRMSDRSFMRGNKRVAIANVNNVSSSFRHGMYVDEDRLLSAFSDIVERLRAEDSAGTTPELTSRFRMVVAVLDRVVSAIVTNEYSGVNPVQNQYRRTLAECLIDHRGNDFASRTRVRRRKTRLADGTVRTENVVRPCYLDVSYADLFSDATSAVPGTMEFDRTAVYESMYNDATGRSHAYLGGTMMGLPRTPSYNGAQWNQVVRAGLPVTEIVGEDGKSWRCGSDAMVAPDPSTLKILGCDHDGDKTNLYMLKPSRGFAEYADAADLTDGLDAFISKHGILDPKFRHLSDAGRRELEDRVERLVNLGYLAYETRTETDADGHETARTLGLVITETGKARIGNSFVQGLFDLNRMLPVSDNSENEVSVYDGYSDERGSAFRGVKAQPADPALWREAMAEDGVLGKPMLDAESGKVIGKPRVATAVQDGAAVVAEARAAMVAMAGALHFAYASELGIGPFATRPGVTERDWLDFMYHVDGLSNMTFDDIKEQICTRLGIRPNMIESVLADIINSADAGGLPTTDAEFIRAFVKYGKAVNDAKSSRHWMSRASDPADYRFQKEFDGMADGFFRIGAGTPRRNVSGLYGAFGIETVGEADLGSMREAAEGTIARKLADWADGKSAGASEREAEAVRDDAVRVMRSLMRATSSIKDPLNGFSYWLQNVAKRSETDAAIDDIVEWTRTVGQLDEARRYAGAVNYVRVDPASNTASSEALRLQRGYAATAGRMIGDGDPRLVDGRLPEDLAKAGYAVRGQKLVDRSNRMRAASALMYDDSIGTVVAARGIRAVRDYGTNLRNALTDYGRTAIPAGDPVRETLAVAAFSAAGRLNPSDTMRCEANMQSVPWEIAAINTTPAVGKSRLNAANIYDALALMGRAMSAKRGHAAVSGSNASLEVRYAVEAMFDVVARFVIDSTAHTKLHIFDFLRETPDANSFGYSPELYGPAAEGLSRLRPSFDGITELQRTEVAKLYERVVIGRELDSDGSLGRRIEAASNGYDLTKGYGLSFALSASNLKSMRKCYASAVRDTRRSHDSSGRSLSEGADRDVPKTLDELVSVFEALEKDKRFGKGFAIEPSALFGQLLPVYACMTSRVTGVPGSDSGSLMSVLPDWVFTRLDAEVARMHADPTYGKWADMAAALDYAPRIVTEYDPVNETSETERLKPRRAVARDIYSSEADLHAIAELYAASQDAEERENLFGRFQDLARKAVRMGDGNGWGRGVPMEPRFHHTLSIFDGVEGVAFRSVLNGTLGTRSAASPVVRDATHPQVTAVSLEPSVPVESAKHPAEEDAGTREMADRMSALLKMWDAGRVEYKGGGKFTIFGKLREEDVTKGSASVFETKVDVEVVDGNGNGGLLTAEQLKARLDSPLYLQSLSVKSGVPVETIRSMDPEKRFAFALKYQPIGLSRTMRPGTVASDSGAGFVNHSGGASGSDTAWAEESAKYGIRTNGYYVKQPDGKKPPTANVALTDEQYRDGVKAYTSAAKKMGRSVTKNNYVLGLMARNFQQARSADAVFAISRGFDGDGILGGTGYAVQMAKNLGKPVHVFDQPTKSWYAWTGNSWEKEDTPVLTRNFAGIGTREMNESGRTAMTDVLYKTFGGPASDVMASDGIGSWRLDAERVGVLTGRIRIARNSGDPNVVYHEFFHSVMGFMRTLGSLGSAEVRELVKKYGKSEKYGDRWFNEEAAAEDFRKLVEGKLQPEKAPTFLQRLKSFLENLWDIVFGGGAEAYGNDMESNPLAGIVLTGRVSVGSKYEDRAPDDSSIQEFLDNAIVLEEMDELDPTDFGLDAEDYPAMSATHTDVTRAMSRVIPERMNRPYNATNTLALEIGRAIASGLDASKLDPDTVRNLNRAQRSSANEIQKAKMMAAVRQVGSVFGIDVSDTAKAENLLFRAMNELYARVSPDGTVQDTVRFADGGSVRKETLVTPNAMSSAIVTACGVTPSDIMELTVSDIRSVLEQTLPNGQKKYGPGNTFRRNVVEPILRALSDVDLPDPANVRLENPEGADDAFGRTLSKIRAGLTNPVLLADGTRGDFALGTPGKSKNPYHDDNISRYADHVSNPDFQYVMHTALDRLYTLKAAMRWYRQIGFEPGNPADTLAIRGIAPNAPEPLDQGGAMASLSVAPEQLDNPLFSAVDFYDQPAFIANHPDAWLDSVMRPNFGGTSLREMAQEEKRLIAGYHVRANALDGILIRALGLDVMPGQGITAIDGDYVSKFAMEGGKTVRKDGGSAVKFEAYAGKKARNPDGSAITVDVNDQRDADFTYKMWKVMAQGGDRMVTGVDRLTFSTGDSADPDYYRIEKVRERASVGEAGGYSDFDRFLLRMHRQLRDDAETPWESVIGDGGLNLYNRVVDAACRAIGNARRRLNTPADATRMQLDAKDFNDDVLSKLEGEGLVTCVERRQAGHSGYVRTQGTLTVSASEWMEYWKRSGMYAKLTAGGRDARTLEFGEGSVARQLLGLFDDVRRFVDAHPYLSDGDGAYFHNVSTPLPWVGGSGYFMYMANRNEREKSELEKNVETLSEYERTFNDMIGKADLSAPASSADDSVIRLFRTLFHTDAADTEAVRMAIEDGDYAKYGVGSGATVRDLALAVYDRLCGMVWRHNGDPVVERLGGQGAVGRMIRSYDRRSMDDASVVSGGSGMRDDMVYRITGILPHNSQLGHAVKRAIDGITNAFAFRATLFNMLTTPDEDGNPTCYARPADDAQDSGGIPDAMWGVVARWWAKTNGFDSEYDIGKTGVQNAQHIYDLVAQDTRNGVRTVKDAGGNRVSVRYGELSNADIDPKSITAFMAKDENPEDASAIGHYALGYAKHLFQSTRTLGTGAVTKQIHRAWAWSKGLSVNFSYFFPIATRFESPIGAVGAIATIAGNTSPDWLRKHADSFARLQELFGKGNAWITKDFLGQKDVLQMLDSNDPYLAELYHWAGVLGIQLSDPDVNPQEHSRAVLRQDLDRVVAYAGKTMGRKAAKNVREIMSNVLLKGGDRAFTYHLNATKLAVTAQMFLKLQAKAAQEGRAFDPVRDLKRYSAYVNSEVGGIDPLQFAWAHPKMQSLMNSLFFSWGWTRGAWEAGGGTALEQLLFGGHDVTPEERRFYRGRWMRMFGEVMIGVPMLAQVLSKLIGETLVWGLDLDDDSLTEEERNRLRDLVGKVRDTPWMTWNNEDKTWMTAYDITPLMAGISARFPSYARFVSKDHPWVKVVSGVLSAGTRNPAFLLGAMPTYEGTDERNSTTTGRRYYQHFGKQGWEEVRWFDNPFKQFLSKMAMPVQRLAEGLAGRSLTYMDHPQPWDQQGDIERWLNPSLDGALANLVRAFIPFSLVSLNDTSEAGALSMAAPVSMGASETDMKKRLAKHIGRWAANDRAGYAFAGMSRKKGQNMGQALSAKSVTVASILREARMNGFSEKDAYRIVDSAVASLCSNLYGRLLDALPDDRDGTFDAQRVAKLLREANRLGRFRRDMIDTLQKRLEKQKRWGYMSAGERARMRDILRYGKDNESAYDWRTLDRINDTEYDY